jgi:glycosyltransferase involved in cell wall biosynthesis
MKILIVNKFYFPRDGVSNYLLAVKEGLENLGHEVRVFAMNDERNLETPDSRYFVSKISFDGFKPWDILKAISRIFYSPEARRKFSALLDDFNPDIIHIHNIYHQISPSILAESRKRRLPVVMHLHDYKLFCPNYNFFVRGKICENCRGGHYFNCFKQRCIKDSYLKSLGASLEMTLHHKIWPIYRQAVSHFIAPSTFMEKKYLEYGWPAAKITCLLNFYPGTIDMSAESAAGDYLLYLGRLSSEKGLKVLIEALNGREEKLKIAGNGPEKTALESMIKEYGLEKQIEFLGFKSKEELKEIVKKSSAIVVPSVWYENMPLAMLEALGAGKPVIASNIGGLPDIIKDKENGFLFEVGDVSGLRACLDSLKNSNYEYLSQWARESVKDLNRDAHLQELLRIYKEIIEKNKQNLKAL